MADAEPDAKLVVDVAEGIGEVSVAWIDNVTDPAETEKGLNVVLVIVFECGIDVTLDNVLDVLSGDAGKCAEDAVFIILGCVNMEEA